MIILTVTKQGNRFVVDDKAEPGSPPVGRGSTWKEALGDWVVNNQERVNVVLDMSEIPGEVVILYTQAHAQR